MFEAWLPSIYMLMFLFFIDQFHPLFINPQYSCLYIWDGR